MHSIERRPHGRTRMDHAQRGGSGHRRSHLRFLARLQGAMMGNAAMTISRRLGSVVHRLFVVFQWATAVLVVAVGWAAHPQPIEQLIPWEKKESSYASPHLMPLDREPFAAKPAPKREKPVNFPAKPASSSPATPASGVAVDRPVRQVRSARPDLYAQGLSRGGAVCGVFLETAPGPRCAQVRKPVETSASRS